MKHILVIRMSAMGDVAMTAPVIKTMLAQNPNTRITIVSKGFLQPIFSNIDNVSFYAADVKGKHKGIKGIYKLFKELITLEIDAVADLHNVLRSKILRSFFKTKGIPVAIIDKGRAEKKALTALKNKVFKPLKTTHQRYADVFNSLGLPVDLTQAMVKEKEHLSDELKSMINYKENEKLIGIAPFAAHDGKKYPLNLMEKVIDELSKNHKILLFGGGAEEIRLLAELEKKYSNSICMAGKVKLTEELTLISNLSAMISMDSGNGHFSALFGIPTITIWGATHPHAGFAPFNQTENCICADRNKYPLLPTSIYGNKIIEGYKDVMLTIPPKTIINRVLSTIE
ncbi:glycosyltransferase family 9 protein [Wenyingzhuangia sp. IMCC45574]